MKLASFKANAESWIFCVRMMIVTFNGNKYLILIFREFNRPKSHFIDGTPNTNCREYRGKAEKKNFWFLLDLD